MTRPLLILIALVALCGAGYVGYDRLYATPVVNDLTPEPDPGDLADAPPDPPIVLLKRAPNAATPQHAVNQVDPGWLNRTVAATGIPSVALRAYARAELTAPAGCGVGWTTLAGIGWIESQHGRIGGRSLRPDGRSTKAIIGPALDPSGDFAAIRADADGTRWHGDPEWDHAIGPMQFLPGTWATWGADGDGDGVRNPHDLDDAAAAAARYLCAGRHDLGTGEGWTSAVLTYNQSRAYASDVHAAASHYAAAATQAG
ncbi:lytic murein transglycosylase [Nocardioides sp. GXZ039]|uniref:lytic murein transglycosylase n=1 Tax=Nocardioides sp. GXZ039 TaxID=3136018 RepID=UPI0030F41906